MKSTKKKFSNRIEYLNKKGKVHREDGPAREYKDGTKVWYIKGKRHREDGPAIEYSDGSKFWFLNGIEYSKQEWEQEIDKIKLKDIY